MSFGLCSHETILVALGHSALGRRILVSIRQPIVRPITSPLRRVSVHSILSAASAAVSGCRFALGLRAMNDPTATTKTTAAALPNRTSRRRELSRPLFCWDETKGTLGGGERRD